MNIISPYNYKGIPVPRVTEILSKTIHEDYITKWANYLGFKHISYQAALDESAKIGTITHERISQILLGDSPKEDEPVPVQSFLIWYNGVKSSNNVKVIYSEKTLVCPRYGGTLDALLEINGKSYLIDFKTSNHVTFKYFLQLAAYKMMLKEIEGIELTGGEIILQLDKFNPSFEEYCISDIQTLTSYETAFNKLVDAYYAIKCCENLKLR